jgi:hypothetical protein
MMFITLFFWLFGNVVLEWACWKIFFKATNDEIKDKNMLTAYSKLRLKFAAEYDRVNPIT